MAEIIDDAEYNAEVLFSVARSLMQAGNKEKASETAIRAWNVVEMILNEWDKSKALEEIASDLDHVGDKDAFNRALAVALTINDGYLKVKALRGIAIAMAKTGSMEKLDSALEVAGMIGAGYEYEASEALIGVAQSMIKAGDLKRASEVSKRSLAIAQTITDESLRRSNLIAVIRILSEIGDMETLEEILVIAEKIVNEDYGSEVISEAALALTQNGNFKRGSQVFRLAFSKAHLAGRTSVFSVFGNQLKALGATQQWQTFWNLYEAMNEIDGWW